jgi:hypothetical protein
MLKFYSSIVGAAVTFLTLVSFTISANAQDAQQTLSAPIAIVGSSVISEEEVERIAAGRPRAYADLPVEERRARIADTLVAEYLIDYYYGRDTQKLSPQVLDALNDARRQVLLQFYAQSQFMPPEITDAEVADFAVRHPDLFGDRRSYSFVVVTLSGGTVEARQVVQTRLQDMLSQPELDISALDRMVSGLQDDGVTAGLNTVWQTSEALGDDVLSRLDAMVRDNRRIDISQQLDATSVLLLNSAVRVPVDPARLRGQIEQRLIAEAFNDHREDLIRRTAQTVLNPPEAAVSSQSESAIATVAPPPRGSVVWSNRPALPRNVRVAALFGVGLFGLLAGGSLWLWLWMVWKRYPRTLKSAPFVPTLRKRSTGLTVTAVGALSLLGSIGLAIKISLETLGVTTAGLTLGSSLSTALVIAVIWYLWRRRSVDRAVEEDLHQYDNPETARKMLARKGNPTLRLAAAFGFAVLYAMSLAMLLDGPLRLS